VRSPKNEGVRLDLPYGSHPYPIDLAGRDARVLAAAELPSPPPLDELLERALDASPPPRLAPGSRVTVIVSDPTRHEPRAALLAAVRRRLPGARITVAVATGTHGPCRINELGLPADLDVINHDGSTDVVELGTTPRGTPVRVHRCVVETDLVVATGCIKPHYFAGFGAGAKAIFPGLGEATAIRINHRLKTGALARAGIVDGNPCREDLEDAVRMVPAPVFLLDGVCGPDDRVHAAVAGDVFTAFRAGAECARRWFTVRAPRAPLVIASDRRGERHARRGRAVSRGDRSSRHGERGDLPDRRAASPAERREARARQRSRSRVCLAHAARADLERRRAAGADRRPRARRPASQPADL